LGMEEESAMMINHLMDFWGDVRGRRGKASNTYNETQVFQGIEKIKCLVKGTPYRNQK